MVIVSSHNTKFQILKIIYGLKNLKISLKYW